MEAYKKQLDICQQIISQICNMNRIVLIGNGFTWRMDEQVKII